MSDAFLTATQAAEYLGVSRQTIYAYVSRGLLTSEPTGDRSRRYSRAALDQLRARREVRRETASGALRGGAPLLESSLTVIHEGRLRYRGHDAIVLSRGATLEQVASLLWTGNLDQAAGLFPAGGERAGAADGRLADRLVASLVARRADPPTSLSPVGAPILRAAASAVAGMFDAAGARGDGDLAERLARGWGTPRAEPLRAALILCADHGLAASAFTARCVASTDAPIHNVLLAALCALEGRRHGGAVRELDDLLAEIARGGADATLGRMIERRGQIPGLTVPHPLYPAGDPRAAELLRLLDLPGDDPAARAIAFARGHGGAPTVDFALAALGRRLGLPTDGGFAIFALGRSVGWVAHALEAAGTGTLIRPRARYVGAAPLD
jgi:citrate synthase